MCGSLACPKKGGGEKPLYLSAIDDRKTAFSVMTLQSASLTFSMVVYHPSFFEFPAIVGNEKAESKFFRPLASFFTKIKP
jgi:hypothetical protein